MQISFRHFRKVEIDNNVHSLNVDTTSEQVAADKIATQTLTEVMEHTITIFLERK